MIFKNEFDKKFIRNCIVQYKNIPLDMNGNKDWTKAIPLYYDIQQKVGIRNLNKFIVYLDALCKET